MVSTLGSTQADARFDGGVASTVAKGRFTDVGEGLPKLMHAITPDARARRPASDRSAGADPARYQRSLGKRGTLARVAIAVCLGASAIWAWGSCGADSAPEQAAAPAAIETSTSPPAQAASQAASIAQPATTAANEPGAASAERQQVEPSDLVAFRQTVEQLVASQEQLTREIAKLQAEKPKADKPPAEKPDTRMPRRVSAHAAPPAHQPAPKTPMAPPAAPQASTVSALSSAPQLPPQTEPQPSSPPPLRPPMPVPQP